MISTSLNSPIANIFVAICTIVITAGITAAGASNGVSFPLGKVKIPVLAVCTVASFVINLIGFFIAYALHTERFYDITGTLTYIVTICLSLGLSLAYHEPTRSNSRGYILFALVLIWTLRLGFYLFRRALRYGDSRFSAAVHDFTEYLKFWMLQALWVILIAVAALSAITSTHDRGAFANAVNIVLAVIGLILWTVGMLIETVADYQKSVFREDPKNSGRFIKSGLWSCSRHPNYFGEVLLWIGVAFFSGPALFEYQFITLISPIFVFLLIRFGSGVPLLEKSADARWGGQSDYEEYKARVPIFFPIKLTCME